MLLTILAYGMIIIFMYVIMKKKLSPFTSLVIIPLIFFYFDCNCNWSSESATWC